MQQYGYKATFPLLLNVSGQPTYFMALKDASQLVKMYAMVNVQQYQVVATGSTLAQCEKNYRNLLSEYNIHVGAESQDSITGTVAEIRSAVLEGNTRYFIRLEGESWFYTISITDAQICAVLNPGDRVSIGAYDTTGELRSAVSVARAS